MSETVSSLPQESSPLPESGFRTAIRKAGNWVRNVVGPRRKNSNVEPSSIQPGRIDTGEKSPALLESAEDFAKTLTDRFPQLDKDGKLNYYLSGSLSVMLLLQAGRFEVLESARLPEIVPASEKELTPEATGHLQTFVRKIGDVDYVPTDQYVTQRTQAVPHHSVSTGAERDAVRAKFLGQGGIELPELSEKGWGILKSGFGVDQGGLARDDTYRVARISIGGKDFFIAEPKMMLAYKLVHLADSFEYANKTENFVNDFTSLLKGLEAIYPRDELVREAHNIPYGNPNFTTDLQRFYKDMLAVDPNASYIEQMHYGRERAISISKLLHRYHTTEAKQALIDFLNGNRAHIDRWLINPTTPSNLEKCVDNLLLPQNRHLLARLHYKWDAVDEPVSRDEVMEALETNKYWAVNEFAAAFSDKSGFQLEPQPSTLLDVLLLVDLDENSLSTELRDLGELFQLGIEESILRRLITAEFTADPDVKRTLIRRVKEARSRITDESVFENLMTDVSIRVASQDYFDGENFVEIRDDTERAELIDALFKEHDIE